MKKFFSAFISLTLLLQLNSFSITPVFAEDYTISASAAESWTNVSVSSTASTISVSTTDTGYTTQDVTFTATSKVGSGLVFDHWTDSYGNNISQDSVYTQALSTSVDYKAHYENYTPENDSMFSTSDWDSSSKYSFSATTPVKVADGGAVSVSATITIPRNCDVVEAGAIFYEGMYTDGFNIFSENVTISPVSSINKTETGWIIKQATGTFTASYTPTAQYGVLSRAYCIYTDGSSNLYVGYTDEVYTRPDTELYNNVKGYDMVFNWEMLTTFTANSSHSEEIHKKDIYDVATSNPDLITITPQMYRMNLFPTQVEGEGFIEKQAYLDSHEDYSISYSSFYERAKDYIITQGKDPTLEILEAVDESGADCFINYRMNDHHNTSNVNYATHSAFWLENKDAYGVSTENGNMLNYMAPHIRDHYYAIIEELATNYFDYIDGIELDFDRHYTYFKPEEVSQGNEILTDFVARIRDMLNRLSVERGKYLQLSVRVPGQTKKCDYYGIDAITWDAKGYPDIIALSNFFINTMSIDIEAFKDNQEANERAHARIDGEIHCYTLQKSINGTNYRRYLTKEGYYATAYNFLERGADGVHLFNVHASADRYNVYKALTVLRDKQALSEAEKCYVMEQNSSGDIFASENMLNQYVGFKRISINESSFKIYVPDDTALFDSAVLRLEYKVSAEDGVEYVLPEISAKIIDRSGIEQTLERITTSSNELFAPLDSNQAYPGDNEVYFYKIPMKYLDSDKTYTFKAQVTSRATTNDVAATELTSLIVGAEFALYQTKEDLNLLSGMYPGFEEGNSSLVVTDLGADVKTFEVGDASDGDGYALSITNRTVETAGGRFEDITFTPGKLYFVSAYAKLPQSSDSTAQVVIYTGDEQYSGDAVALSSDGWVRMFYYYDLTGTTGDSVIGDIYVNTPDSTDDIYIDNFELYEVEPYNELDENIFADYNPSFENGSIDKWGKHQSEVGVVQADPIPHTGKYAGYSWNRNDGYTSKSNAAGLQTTYIPVESDTYYYVSGWVRAKGTDTFKSSIALQGRYRKGNTNGTGTSLIKSYTEQKIITGNEWTQLEALYLTGAELEGYTLQCKLYANVPGADISSYFVDDFYACPIKILDKYKTVTVNNGTAVVEMIIPRAVEVSDKTLSCSGCSIQSIERNGAYCAVTIDGAEEGKDYTLTLTISDNFDSVAYPEFNFKTYGYSLDLTKSADQSTVTGVFRNYTSISAPVRYIAASYKNNRLVSCTMLDPVQIESYTAGEEFTLPLVSDADRIEILVWEPSKLIPYISPFDCSGL